MKASPLKSMREPLRRKAMLLERTAGRAEAAAVAAITVASACRPPRKHHHEPPKEKRFMIEANKKPREIGGQSKDVSDRS